MKKILKPMLLVLSAVLLVVASVLGTMAYMTSSAAVSNVFTIGNVKLHMYETKVDSNGQSLNEPLIDGMKTADTNSYHLVPGKTYLKDPTIYVDGGSEASYLYVRVRNDIATIECKTNTVGHEDHKTIEQQLADNGWMPIEFNLNDVVYVYVGAENVVDATKEEILAGTVQMPTAALVGGVATRQSYDVFHNFTVDTTLSTETLQKYGGARVAIVAYAIQANDLNNSYDIGSYDAYMAAWGLVKVDLPFVN